jgi:hypothetical protein
MLVLAALSSVASWRLESSVEVGGSGGGGIDETEVFNYLK